MGLAALSPSVIPDTSIFPALFGGVFPYMILLSLLLIIIWFFIDWNWIIVPCVSLILFWQPISQFWTFNRSIGHTTETISVGTFNLYGLKMLKLNHDDEMLEDLRKTLNTPKLDIICFQESNGFSNKILDDLLDFEYKYQYLESGVKLVSRHAIEDKGTFDFNSNVNSCLWTDVRIQDRVIRVYCAHLQSNRVSSSATELIEKGDLTEKNTWLGVRSMLGRYKVASKIRDEQSNRIKTHASGCEHPVLICGDLNDHPLSHPVHQLACNYQDSFKEKGFGWGTTYGGSIPMLRIDYILADSAFRVINHSIEPNDYSDHYFVHAGLEIKDKEDVMDRSD